MGILKLFGLYTKKQLNNEIKKAVDDSTVELKGKEIFKEGIERIHEYSQKHAREEDNTLVYLVLGYDSEDPFNRNKTNVGFSVGDADGLVQLLNNITGTDDTLARVVMTVGSICAALNDRNKEYMHDAYEMAKKAKSEGKGPFSKESLSHRDSQRKANGIGSSSLDEGFAKMMQDKTGLSPEEILKLSPEELDKFLDGLFE